MSSWELIGFMVFILALIAVAFIFYMQYDARRAVEGMMYITVILEHGGRIDKLATVEGVEVKVSKGSGKGIYLIDENHSFNTLYPPNRPKLLQVTVKSAIYAEGRQEPLNPFTDRPVITPMLHMNIQDKAFTDTLSRETIKNYEETDITSGKGKLKLPWYVYAFAGVLLVGVLILGWMVIVQGSSIDAIADRVGVQ